MTTEELKDLRTRVLEAINRELQPTRMTDEELLKAITSLVDRESRGDYLLPIQKMDTVNSIYKMYRGLGGLLDSILADEDITEVMINGPDNIFVERKCRVAASARSKAVGIDRENWLIDGFQNHTDSFLHQLVSEYRKSQRAQLAVLLLNIGSAYRLGFI